MPAPGNKFGPKGGELSSNRRSIGFPPQQKATPSADAAAWTDAGTTVENLKRTLWALPAVFHPFFTLRVAHWAKETEFFCCPLELHGLVSKTQFLPGLLRDTTSTMSHFRCPTELDQRRLSRRGLYPAVSKPVTVYWTKWDRWGTNRVKSDLFVPIGTRTRKKDLIETALRALRLDSPPRSRQVHHPKRVASRTP